jgi:hypothetical protein
VQSGEKLFYPLAIIEWLRQQQGSNIGIMYDIACKMHPYAAASKVIVGHETITYALAEFHAYAHNAACQVCVLFPRVQQ